MSLFARSEAEVVRIGVQPSLSSILGRAIVTSGEDVSKPSPDARRLLEPPVVVGRERVIPDAEGECSFRTTSKEMRWVI